MAGETQNINIKISKLDQLINVDSDSIYPGTGVDSDAAEYLHNEADLIRLNHDVQLEINIPKITKEEINIVENVLHKFFDYKAEIAKKELSKNFAQGITALIFSVILFFSCAIIYLLFQALGASDAVMTLLTSILVIACWVAVWTPVEIFLFNWWPIRHEVRVFRKLSSMEIIFKKN
jgi:C4-dicarboxylate transporter